MESVNDVFLCHLKCWSQFDGNGSTCNKCSILYSKSSQKDRIKTKITH